MLFETREITPKPRPLPQKKKKEIDNRDE